MSDRFAVFGVLACAFVLQCSQADHDGEAVASFSKNGIDGSVVLSDGQITIDMDLNDLDLDYIGGSECFKNGGLSYHVHETWSHYDDYDRLGPIECGSSNTGGHWDAWLACGGASGNHFCSSENDNGCVDGSSVFGKLPHYDGYDCDEVNYFDNPYCCETGDWSGKYGKIEVDMYNNRMHSVNSNAFEMSSTDLKGKSIVFHCSDGTRAFCAPFVLNDDDDKHGHNRPSQDTKGKIAKFDALNDDSFIKLAANGEYEIEFELSGMDLPSDCDYLEYRVYNNWENEDKLSSIGDNECCANGIGKFYDPTVSCADDSDSKFCYDGERCGDEYDYYFCDYSDSSKRLDCAPGDLSGKYGAIYTGSSGYKHSDSSDSSDSRDSRDSSDSSDSSDSRDGHSKSISFSTSGEDDLMIDLRQLDGKSAVLQCRNSLKVVACAQFRDYDDLHCPRKCDKCPCGDDEIVDCKVSHSGQGCSQCYDGYFQKSNEYKCGQCQETFGKHCMHCSNEQGCQQCEHGYFRVFDSECGLYYCV